MLLAASFLPGCGTAVENGEETPEATTHSASLPEPAIRRVEPPALDVEQRRRQAEVDQYLAQRYDDLGWRIVETTQTYIGDIIDWLDQASVPGSDAEPPPRPSPEELRPPPGTELQVTELDLYPELRGPEGTIPMTRPRFASYVRGETTAVSINDFLRNHVVQGQPAGQNRLYGGIRKVASNNGLSSWVSEFSGIIEAGTFSLLEMATLCPGTNPSTTLEQIGIAASRDSVNFGDSIVRLQVEFLTAGDLVGPQKGGWDGIFAGFVPAAGRPYGPGVAIPASEIFGSQQESRFNIQRDSSGNWWVGHNGNWLGYYPGSLFNLINTGSCQVYWYGEVYDPTPTDWTWTNMGSGLFGAQGYGFAAYFRNPQYIGLWGLSTWPDGASNVGPMDPACYTSTNLTTGAAPWERYFYLGGPGGDGFGCN